MIGVTSNQDSVNTSVSEESRACFQFGGGAFVRFLGLCLGGIEEEKQPHTSAVR